VPVHWRERAHCLPLPGGRWAEDRLASAADGRPEPPEFLRGLRCPGHPHLSRNLSWEEPEEPQRRWPTGRGEATGEDFSRCIASSHTPGGSPHAAAFSAPRSSVIATNCRAFSPFAQHLVQNLGISPDFSLQSPVLPGSLPLDTAVGTAGG
jgi:hypothetical protein